MLNLQWNDILWDVNKLRIDSPKTGLRFCPIFPEILPELEAAFADAPEGAKSVIQRYRPGANLSTQMNRIISLAGQKPWPKLFQNLRATRRTELEEVFPNHVVNEWMGHSGVVAEKHYLQVTPDHWNDGSLKSTGAEIKQPSSCGYRGGNGSANQQQSGTPTGEEFCENEAADGHRLPEITHSVPPQGLEPWTR